MRDLLDAALPAGTLVSLAVYGSAIGGGLRPESDLDLFGVLRRRVTDDENRALVRGLVPISWHPRRPARWRPVELTLVVQDELRPWRYPPRFDFQYGEWLRERLTAGDLAPWPRVNPDVALLATMVRSHALTIRGRHPSELLDPVPRTDLVRAILDELPSLIAELEFDTRNVVLTLARMWLTIETGDIGSKDAAAAWASARLPSASGAIVERARRGYLGLVSDRWDDVSAARRAADEIADRIMRGAARG